MRNIKLQLSYDGTRYLGWQKTKMGHSIEESLEKAIFQILQHEVTLQAASRTDAGVHAAGQVVNFFTSKDISLNKLKHSLNCVLPKDIAVNTIEEVSISFHPTLNSIGKEYHYHICFDHVQLPMQRHYSWHYPYQLDISKMKQSIPILMGEHDFSAFCNVKKNSSHSHYLRRLESIGIFELPQNCLRFEIRGNNFLYKMVRNLVGTFICVGCGKIALEDVKKILSSQDRKKAGFTAPSHGLFLQQVFY
jgi:tRNA pseudouridine38-40 synthase